MTPRFLQIHTLTGYSAALLNRDDNGLAKRLPYGGAIRTRVSSQCLKRHWRMADDVHSLHTIDGAEAARRSREAVTHEIIAPLTVSHGADIAKAIGDAFQLAVYGDKGHSRTSRQILLLGAPELRWLKSEAERLAGEAGGDAKQAAELAKDWHKAFRANAKAMREATALPGGLTGALFGRMVTSDPEANIAAPVHVAHSFTVHPAESELDFYAAVDDLDPEEGAGNLGETELTSGLYYGYVVIDLAGLLSNLGGDGDMAGQVVHNLIHLIAEVTPGAKLGSTAPYGRAGFMMVEAGDRQPRSLAEAFRVPCKPDLGSAVAALTGQLARFDECYATGEERHAMSLANGDLDGMTRGGLVDLARFGAGIAGQGGERQA